MTITDTNSPTEPDSRIAEAYALVEAGNAPKAIAVCDAILSDSPCNATALHLRGALAHQAGDCDLGAALIDRAIAIEPGNPRSHLNRGAIADAMGDPASAAKFFGRAVTLAPGYAYAQFRHGDALARLGRMEEALAAFDTALAIEPGRAGWLIARANILKQLGRPLDAVKDYDQAIAVDRSRADAFTNRGIALHELGRHEAALRSHDQAVALDPSATAHYNRANLLSRMGRRAEAIVDFDAALRMAPDDPSALWNRASALLACGRMAEGWRDYEYRWRLPHWAPPRATTRPPWHGDADIEGKTILIWGEQGFGDKLQFARFIPMLAARGATVLLETDRRLLPLLRGLAGVTAAAPIDEPFPDDAFDMHCPMMSLALALDAQLDNLPGVFPYLAAPSDASEKWKRELGAGSRPRIGIAWSGNKVPDPNRSIPLRVFSRLLDVDAEWVCLQNELRPADSDILRDRHEIRFLGSRITDFADTAAICEQCDLVISIDTSIAHLAGGMAKPLWILLPHVADWRWLYDRDDSPWYPGARLYRQRRQGDWDEVIARVQRDLFAWRGSSAAQRCSPSKAQTTTRDPPEAAGRPPEWMQERQAPVILPPAAAKPSARGHLSGIFPGTDIMHSSAGRRGTSKDLPAGDYVSPGMQLVFPDDCFPNLMTIDRSTVKDPTVRHEIPHNILADRRIPHIAFANRDEAHIIFNTALLFAGKPGLAIGCFLGWSTCHLALGGVRLDAVDPLLDRPDIRRNVEASLAAAKVLDRVNLVAGESPEMVRRLASSGDRRWSLVLIEGKRATPGLPKNAEICLAHCATDALVLITDLVSPVAWEEFDHFRQAGWQTRIYDTAQIMGVAWRGAVRPIDHRPDPEVTWSRPGHMRDAQETRGHQVAPDSIATSGMKLSPRIDFAAARSIMQQAAIFVPNSAGDIAATFGQTMLGVGQTLPALATLADVIGHAAVPIIDIGALERTPAAIQATDELGRLFRHHGSDKSTVHDYHLLYGALLADPTQVKAVLEIGLGTNNVAVVSNMGTTGRPGASLRAFRDWLPDAQIFGADVDRGILFEEPRIRTFFVDQTSPKTLIQLGDVIGLSFDLVIDDGLHTPNANLNTLAFALPRIRPGGWVVIEDIPERALDIWRIVSSLLPPGYRPQLIRARGGYLFVLRRPLSTPT